ncbi:MAG: family 20 glycosylhydrolase [Acidobacteriota bacterium]|nr:family 20 glycosylhydrolase [Acidobacteriota bacterium]
MRDNLFSAPKSKNALQKTPPAGAVLGRRDLLKMTGAALIGGSGAVNPRSGMASVHNPMASILSGGPSDGDAIENLPLIYPPPREMVFSGPPFKLDSKPAILLPVNAAASDLFLSRTLRAELSRKYDLLLETRRLDRMPDEGKIILMGSMANPLIREYCAREQVQVSEQNPGPEGYLLRVDSQAIVIAGASDRGAFYGLQSLLQAARKGPHGVEVNGMRVRDWPDKPFRGIYLFLPGPANLPFFKRFLSGFAARYKFNTIMMEMNACMRLDSHPELNTGWVEFTRDANYSRRNYPPGALHERGQNSSHQDCGDGLLIEKEDVASLASLAEQNYIEIVPVIQSLTHCYYLLSKHKDLSEVPGDKWPDTYCPSNPKSYRLLFEVMDEFLGVMKPRMVHAGHDEWFAPFGLCPCCQNKDPGVLYGQDLRKIHDYLAQRGVKMAIWGDYLLEGVRGKGLRKHKTRTGWTYYSPGAMTPQQVRSLVPKDILIFNWFWAPEDKGKQSEAQLDEFGFRQVYGNLEPGIRDYTERSKRSTLMGGAPSSWAASTEFNMGKDLMSTFLGCSSLLWSKSPSEAARLPLVTQAMAPAIRIRLSGKTPPSETGDPIVPADISAFFNVPARENAFGLDLRGVKTGRVMSAGKVFDLAGPAGSGGNAVIVAGSEGAEPNPLPREVAGIKVGEDATSLIFLHACARPASNKEAYRLIWDEHDSADLLGWYDVVFEDGLQETIPIRYGVNILEWNWEQHPPSRSYAYAAEKVVCGMTEHGPITFFAWEWTNPRLGKAIREIRLRGSVRFRGAAHGFTNSFGEIIPTNAVILKALSFVRRRDAEGV